ncbi:MAG: ATP synthase F1 subunit epsilon [Alphaproteobacteria bacterium]|nr:ATP synthase F1 subunit epsilon [Alphaproteobacteria bacterium]|tara:strand:- start:34547 stop:34981 length:435 start_codon:yes stop_codon:yes gene_type:complete
MSGSLQFEIVSPEEKLVSEPVHLAVMPGEAGEFGVGADHVPVVASLKYGVVKLYMQSLDEKKPRHIFITGGFADVAGKECIVLAEDAIDVDDLGTVEDLTKAMDKLSADLDLAATQGDRLRMKTQIEITAAKIDAVKNKPNTLY